MSAVNFNKKIIAFIFCFVISYLDLQLYSIYIYILERSTLFYLISTLEADQDVMGTCRLPIDQGSLPEAVRAH